MLFVLVTTFPQFIGGAVISYYMPTILQDVGITGSNQQLLLNALNTVFSFLSGIAGSFTVDKFGRRQLFLWGTFLTGLVYNPINVLAAKASGHIGTGSGYAFIAMIFLYGIFLSFTWTPLQALYPAEVLNIETRAKGMAFQGFVSGLEHVCYSRCAQEYWMEDLHPLSDLPCPAVASHVGNDRRDQGRSLEELDEIFRDPKPVKKSKERHEVVVKQGEGVKMEMS
jgi:hypothetical protein